MTIGQDFLDILYLHTIFIKSPIYEMFVRRIQNSKIAFLGAACRCDHPFRAFIYTLDLLCYGIVQSHLIGTGGGGGDTEGID